MPLEPRYGRVATFSAREVHEERSSGHWSRAIELSSETVAAQANRFLDDNQASPVTTSSPSAVLVGVSADKKRRTYLIQMSLIYTPNEIVVDDDNLEQETEKLNVARRAKNLGIEGLDQLATDHARTILSELEAQAGKGGRTEEKEDDRQVLPAGGKHGGRPYLPRI